MFEVVSTTTLDHVFSRSSCVRRALTACTNRKNIVRQFGNIIAHKKTGSTFCFYSGHSPDVSCQNIQVTLKLNGGDFHSLKIITEQTYSD